MKLIVYLVSYWYCVLMHVHVIYRIFLLTFPCSTLKTYLTVTLFT